MLEKEATKSGVTHKDSSLLTVPGEAVFVSDAPGMKLRQPAAFCTKQVSRTVQCSPRSKVVVSQLLFLELCQRYMYTTTNVSEKVLLHC